MPPYSVPLTERIRRRLRERRANANGLALLDVLLGMAIFALIAVIAAQAFGMFRHRAYLTQAVSDAKQVSTGVLAKLTETGAKIDDIPTGTFTPDRLEALGGLGINMTAGNWATISPSSEVGGGFDVCVQNDHAYAWWRAEGAAIADYGYLPEGEGCHPGLPGGGDDDDDGTTGNTPTPDGWGADPGLDCGTTSVRLGTIPYDPDYDDAVIPRISELGLEPGDLYFPDQVPGMTKEIWEDKRAPWASWGSSWRVWFTAAEAAAWTVDGDGFSYNDSSGNAVRRDVAVHYTWNGSTYACDGAGNPGGTGCYVYGENQQVWYDSTPTLYAADEEVVTFSSLFNGTTPWAQGYDENDMRTTWYDWWYTDVTEPKAFYDGGYGGGAVERVTDIRVPGPNDYSVLWNNGRYELHGTWLPEVHPVGTRVSDIDTSDWYGPGGLYEQGNVIRAHPIEEFGRDAGYYDEWVDFDTPVWDPVCTPGAEEPTG